MSKLKLVIGSKAYSSWSLRPWILLRQFGLAFEETVIVLDQPDTHSRILAFSPTGRVPLLIDGDIVVWDSLAIVEYLAELRPDLAIWPRDRAARAWARALSAEMHSGFAALRQHCPTQFARPVRKRELTPEVRENVQRLEAAWGDARARHAGGGPFLFGSFSAADAMFAPVVNRLHVYDVEVTPGTRAYMTAIQDLPAWAEWVAGARAEPWRNPEYEAI